jgi:hypothetical protein
MHAQRNYLNLLLNVRNVDACLAASGREFHSPAIRKLNVLLIFTLEALLTVKLQPPPRVGSVV